MLETGFKKAAVSMTLEKSTYAFSVLEGVPEVIIKGLRHDAS
jgi:hypothetical protein